MTGKILKNVVIGILGLVAVSLMTKGGFYMVVGFLLIALLLFKNYLDGKTKKEMDSLIETANKVLTTEQMDYIDLKNESDTLSANIANYSKEKANLEMELALLKEKVKSESKQLLSLTDELEMESFALYKPRYNFSDALGYKDKLDEIRLKQQKMIKSKTAVNYSKDWTVDGSKAKGTKMTNDNIKQIIRCFNADCEAAINKIKFNNIQTIENRIYRSFEQLNKLNSTNRVSITNEFLNLKLQELYLGHEYEEKRQEEKEILREEREKEKEEKKLQKEEANNIILGEELRHYFGAKYIEEEIEGLKFKIYPDSFFQVNKKQAEKLYNKAIEFFGEIEDKTIVDAFSGTGTIGMLLAKKAKNVIGIESIESSVMSAKESALENNIENIKFICGKVEKEFSKVMKSEKIDGVIFDPPRKGIDEKVLNVLKENRVPSLVYISCNPSTFARDAKILDDLGYKLEKIASVDMFSQTHHIEVVAKFVDKK